MQSKHLSEVSYRAIMWLIIIISMIIAVLFCIKKQGFHYDENYSYYSTNITYGLNPTDNEWKNADEIRSEFMVNSGESLNLGLVKLNQSYDVHPPLYYYVLRVVCFMTKNTFSKWQGLTINLAFYFVCLLLLWKIADIFSNSNKLVNAFTLILFGLSPGYLSTITFIRMYVMLTCLCFLLLLIAMLSFKSGEWSFKKCFIPTTVISCLGFLTHYYFIMFAFFVAAFVCLYLVFHKETRIKAFIYGGSVSVGILAAIAYYPACLSHIFSGYRGTEATQAFADVSNTFERINFFVQILNDYTFSGLFFILVLTALLVYMLYAYRSKLAWAKRMSEEKEQASEIKADRKLSINQIFVAFITICFFLMVCKTGMIPSNPAEALRYACPSYGLIILLVVSCIFAVFNGITTNKILPLVILVVAVVFQIKGLLSDKVFFVYSEDTQNYAWADEHKDADVAFIYNPVNKWMIWKDSIELMSYNQIYFLSMDNEDDIEDSVINNSDCIYVYACRSDLSQKQMQKMIDNNDKLSSIEKVQERLFVDIYQLK